MKILAYINTYNRYDTTFPMALLSIINQTRKPDKIHIYDDNKVPCDPQKKEHLNYLFKLMDQKGIPYWYEFAGKKGAHHNHEKANMAGFDAAWFIDDDNVAESNVLEELEKQLIDGVGAVGCLIIKPPATQLPPYVTGKLEDIYLGKNIAWHTWVGKPKEVEHLYSGFLYRCNIVHHDLRLSKKAFRGETMFTHSFFLKGYKLICTPKAITWHFESDGGCRTAEDEKTNQDMYNNDQFLFSKWLEFKKTKRKLYVLNHGLGDHYMFLQAFPLDKEAIYAVCYPELFKDYGVISIADAWNLVDVKDYDIYAWCEKNNWKGTMVEAYKKLYEHIDKQR